MNMRWFVSGVVLLLCTFTSVFGWEDDLRELIHGEKNVQPPVCAPESLLIKLKKSHPSFDEIKNILTEPPSYEGLRGHVTLKARCSDGVVRPYCLYIPKTSAKVPVPLIIWLHGGVNRKNIADKPKEYAEGSPFFDICKANGWYHLAPFAQKGAVWWDTVGMANIFNQIRQVKTSHNIDDNRVFLSGFSDGASGSFAIAMVKPSTFAAFVPLNGHLGVGSIDGDLSTYANNLKQSPLYTVTTISDPLYPTEKMAPALSMAIDLGANIVYRSIEGTHTLSYKDTEMPRILTWLQSFARNPFPGAIDWETSGADFGACHWLEVTAIDPFLPKRHWHKDANTVLVSDSISIGYIPDTEAKIVGSRVDSIGEGNTAAKNIGLKAGDTIVAAGKKPVRNIKDIDRYKTTLRRGGPIELTVLRDGERKVLSGTVPPPEYYNVFKRSVPSGRVKVSLKGDTFTIASSQVKSLRILLSSELVEPGKAVKVQTNSQRPYFVTTRLDYRFLINRFLKNRDRKALYYGYLDVTIR